MSLRSRRGTGNALLLVAAVALAGTAAYTRHAQADEDDQGGRIVNISPDAAAGDVGQSGAGEQQQADAQPAFWLGIQGQPLDSHVLRTHLQLADDVGVAVEDVVKGSPAEKAGLRRHDVLIDANGEQISDMAVLQKVVAESAGKPIELKLIRLAKEMMLTITPEERPAGLAQSAPGVPDGQLPGNLPMGELQDMFRQMQQGGLPGGVRVFGPGMLMNGQRLDLQRLPGGVEVKITREGDQPAEITVRKGDQSWTVEGDDEEALKKLPDDVRPFVEQMLGNNRLGNGFFQNLPNGADLRMALPDNLGNFRFDLNANAEALGRKAEEASQQMLKRVEELERQIEQLQRSFDGEKSEDGSNPAADPTKT